MKKIISLVLSLALVACMFSMSVSAKHIVGTYSDRDTIDDGLTDAEWALTSYTSSHSESITFNIGAKHSRYAVDVEFTGALSFNTGNMTWDVNNLEYLHTNNSLADTEYGITVTNYSDQAVGLTLDVLVNDTASNAGMNFEISDFPNDYTLENLEVSGVLAGAYEADPEVENAAKQATMKVQLYAGGQDGSYGTSTADDWNDVALYLANNSNGAASMVLATMTVTITKNTP